MLCCACGRKLSNDPDAENAARWTLKGHRYPYCADNEDCLRDALDIMLQEIPKPDWLQAPEDA